MVNKNNETKSFDEKDQKDEKQELTFNNLLRGKSLRNGNIFKFKVSDFLKEYKALSQDTLKPVVVAYSAPVCKYEGIVPSKETMLQNFGGTEFIYFIEFFKEGTGQKIGQMCSFKCKLNHVFQNGKRLVDEAKFEPFKSRFVKQVCIQAGDFDDNLLLDENIEIRPYYCAKGTKSQKFFENAVCKAILKHQALKNHNLETHNIGNNTPKQNIIENGKGKE